MVELIAKRYGSALFDLSVESGELDSREEEIRFVAEAFKAEKDFMSILNHPKLTRDNKRKMIIEIFDGKVSDDLIGFLVLAIEKNRQEFIVDILEYTLQMIMEHNGFVTANVTSAVELTKKDKTAIMEKLQKQTGKKITLDTVVDPSIIGGLIIRINDRIVDNSIKRNLHRMAVDLSNTRI